MEKCDGLLWVYDRQTGELVFLFEKGLYSSSRRDSGVEELHRKVQITALSDDPLTRAPGS